MKTTFFCVAGAVRFFKFFIEVFSLTFYRFQVHFKNPECFCTYIELYSLRLYCPIVNILIGKIEPNMIGKQLKKCISLLLNSNLVRNLIMWSKSGFPIAFLTAQCMSGIQIKSNAN